MKYGNNAYEDEQGKKLLGCPPEFWGKAIVCYLDLLGFSNFIFQKFSHKSYDAIEKFLEIKNYSYIASQGKTGVKFAWKSGDLPPHLRDAFYRPIVHSSSDSIILSTALPEEITSYDFILALSSLHIHISWIVKKALQQGFALRGGIEIGETYWNEKDIIGPAFINAYQIESKIAKQARIIYGPELLKESLTVPDSPVWLYKAMWKDIDGLIMLKPDIQNGKKKDRNELRAMYKKCKDQAVKQKERNKYKNVNLYFKDNPDMPEETNFDSEYVARLVSRFSQYK